MPKKQSGELFSSPETPGSITGVSTTENEALKVLITVDTLSFAARFDDENSLFDFLGLDRSLFERSESSQQNYSYSYYFQGIILSFGGKANWKNYIHMSGKGCRTFEDLRGDGFEWADFLKAACNQLVDFRRIDIAADEFTGLLTFDKCDQYYRAGKVAGKARHFEVTYGDKRNFQAGSKNSICLIRIYDKALERGYKDSLIDGHPWTRCEMQLRDPYAGQLIIEWLGSGDLASVFSGHVLEQLRFTTKKNDKKNAQRLKTAKWWSDFLGDVKQVKFVSKPGSDYNLHRCQKYLFNQAASSIKAWIMAQHLQAAQVYETFIANGIKLNDNQKAMVRMYRGNGFIFDDEEVNDSSFCFDDSQTQIDLINHILASE